MVLSLLTRGAGKLAKPLRSFFGASTGRAAAGGAVAGAGGGVLLDDIPILGSMLDPTEGSGGPGPFALLVLAVLAFVAMFAVSEVTD